MTLKKLFSILLISSILFSTTALMEEISNPTFLEFEATGSNIDELNISDDSAEEENDEHVEFVSNEEITSDRIDETVEEQTVELEDMASKTQDGTYLYELSDGYVNESYEIELFAEGEGDVEINSTNFPDKQFLSFIRNSTDINPNNDNWLQPNEIQNCSQMKINKYDPDEETDCGYDVKQLTGIGLFTNLEVLDCSNNKLTSLDLSSNINLKELECSNNPITSLDLSKNTNLTALYCREMSKLSELNVSGCSKLSELVVCETKVKKLDLTNNTELSFLNCSENDLDVLLISNCTKLERLYCEENKKLSSLDIKSCPNMVKCVKEGQKSDNSKDWLEPSVSYKYKDENGKEYILEIPPKTKLIYEEDVIPPTSPETEQIPVTSTPTESTTISKSPASVKARAAKKGKVKISWKKIKKTKKTKALRNQIKAIEVQYSTDPNFDTDVNTKTVGKKKTKVTIKSLQKKTTYYVRVRYADGTGGVSNWSKVKKVRAK